MTWCAPSALTRGWLAGPAVAMTWAPRNEPRATSRPPVTPPALRLAVQNHARHPIIFEEALHTYFAISDITGIAISGLAGTTYIDKSDFFGKDRLRDVEEMILANLCKGQSRSGPH